MTCLLIHIIKSFQIKEWDYKVDTRTSNLTSTPVMRAHLYQSIIVDRTDPTNQINVIYHQMLQIKIFQGYNRTRLQI